MKFNVTATPKLDRLLRKACDLYSAVGDEKGEVVLYINEVTCRKYLNDAITDNMVKFRDFNHTNLLKIVDLIHAIANNYIDGSVQLNGDLDEIMESCSILESIVEYLEGLKNAEIER